jgi:hypothetical protein
MTPFEIALATPFVTAAMVVLFDIVATVANKWGRYTGWVRWGVILPFVILDWIYNWTFGSLLCLQLPKEWDELATKRLKRYKREYDFWDTGLHGWRLKVALTLCPILSKFDKEHC